MRITIKLKLALSFALVVAMLVGLATLSIVNLAKLDETLDNLVHGPVVRLQYALQISGALSESVRQQKNALLATNAEEMDSYYKKSDASIAIIRDLANKGFESASEQNKPLWDEIRNAAEIFAKDSAQLPGVQISSGQQAAISLSNGEIRKVANATTEAAGKLVALQQDVLVH